MKKKLLKNPFFQALLPWVGAFYIRFVFFTSRKTYIIPESIKPYATGDKQAIFVFWHGRMMLMPCLNPRKRTMRVLISKHRDGRFISQIIHLFKQKTISGSTSNGAIAAMREAIGYIEAGDNISITPDGPRGPFQVAAEGAAHLAEMTGLPIVAISFSASRHKRFGSWDKFMLAHPFSRIVFTSSEPFTDSDIPTLTQTMQNKLNELTDKADRIAAERTPLPYAIYALVTRIFAPFVRVFLLVRKWRGKEDRLRGKERFGVPSLPRPGGKLVWTHAASVGEALALLPVIEKLRSETPLLNILLTTGTVTSAALMKERLPFGVIHQYIPVDTPQAIARFYKHWQPDLGLLVESEIWPNLIMKAPCPLLLFNARMSPHSLKSWQKMPGFASALMARFSLIAAQSEDDAARFRALGAANVKLAGNIKHAAAPLPVTESILEMLKAHLAGRPIVVAASTHPGEEEYLGVLHAELKNQFPNLVTVIAPRHPNRGEAIQKMLKSRHPSFDITLRTEDKLLPKDIYIANTLGELGLFYRLANVVIMGGSFVPHGGQNPLEPARLGAAVVCGPHMFNFTTITNALKTEDGLLQVEHWEALTPIIAALLEDKEQRDALADAALRWSKEQQHVMDHYMTLFTPYLNAHAHT